MGYGTAILIILVVGLAAAAVTLVVQKSVATDLRREHHEVGSTVFLQLGVIFAVLLAFVFSEAWTEYNEASAAIDLEVGAMHGAAMIAATLPVARRKAHSDQGEGLSRQRRAKTNGQSWPRTAAKISLTDRKLRALIQAAANLRFERPCRKRQESRKSCRC